MKKVLTVIAGIAAAAMLAACGTAQIEPQTLADSLSGVINFSEQLTPLSENITLKRYGLDETLVTEAAGYAGTQAVVDEIAVFKTADADAVIEKVNARLSAQETSYTSYAPDEVPKLQDAVVESVGDCVIVCVSEDASADVKTVISGLTK